MIKVGSVVVAESAKNLFECKPGDIVELVSGEILYLYKQYAESPGFSAVSLTRPVAHWTHAHECSFGVKRILQDGDTIEVGKS